VFLTSLINNTEKVQYGDSTSVQTTCARAEELELADGQIVWLRPEIDPVSV
jgi:hypothetical protein